MHTIHTLKSYSLPIFLLAIVLGASVLFSLSEGTKETKAAGIPSGKLLGQDWTLITDDANWSERITPGVAVFDDKLWVIGGYDGGSSVNDVWYSTDGENWTQATANAGWAARANHDVVVFDNKLWVIGGNDGSSRLNDVWYSTDGENWTQATANAGWAARNNFGVTVFDNKMWVMGGSTAGGSENDVWYSTDGENWTQATASADWSARTGFTVETFDGKMWVIGGNDGSPLNDVWYSTDGENWTQATANADWVARFDHQTAVLDNKLWIMGGTGGGNHRDDVYYTEDGETWWSTDGFDTRWAPRSSFGSAAFKDRLWVLGGEGSELYNDVWFSANFYTLYFDTQGGGMISEIPLEAGQTITLPEDPIYDGFTFQHWNTQWDDSGTTYAGEGDFTMSDEDITLYAIWEQDPLVTLTTANADTITATGATLYGHAELRPDYDPEYIGEDEWQIHVGFLVSGSSSVDWSNYDTFLQKASSSIEDLSFDFTAVAEGLTCNTQYWYVSAFDFPDNEEQGIAGAEKTFTTGACPGGGGGESGGSGGGSGGGGGASGGGNSIPEQVRNLIRVGRVADAISLVYKWPHLFGIVLDTTSSGVSGSLAVSLRDLEIETRGEDVRLLQTLLISLGYSIPDGPTDYFGEQTRKALAAYQAANGIIPAEGYFGPLTRTQMKAIGINGLWW